MLDLLKGPNGPERQDQKRTYESSLGDTPGCGTASLVLGGDGPRMPWTVEYEACPSLGKETVTMI